MESVNTKGMGNSASEHFSVQGSGKAKYQVTINYETGHFCTCRGMLSKVRAYGSAAGHTKGTCCKHVSIIINSDFEGAWGFYEGKRKPKTKTTPITEETPFKPTGRRAAILQQRVKRAIKASDNLVDRISALKASQ